MSHHETHLSTQITSSQVYINNINSNHNNQSINNTSRDSQIEITSDKLLLHSSNDDNIITVSLFQNIAHNCGSHSKLQIERDVKNDMLMEESKFDKDEDTMKRDSDWEKQQVTSNDYAITESSTNVCQNNTQQIRCSISKSLIEDGKSNILITKENEEEINEIIVGRKKSSSDCLTIGLEVTNADKEEKFTREIININGNGEIEHEEMHLERNIVPTEDDDKWLNDGRGCHRKSNLKRTFKEMESSHSLECGKRTKKSITFDKVSVYYFQRTQGFICVPSKGGSTLGMSHNHSYARNFSLNEYVAEQKRMHTQQLLCNNSANHNHNHHSPLVRLTTTEDSEDSEEVEDVDYYDNPNYIQPIPTRERRAMLRSAGVDKIESSEKDDCKAIRISREYCGCQCQTYCNPDTCICSLSGIKCQMDRVNFPCSCTKDGCANVNGRIEFNALRVRSHYIRTLMRMELENKSMVTGTLQRPHFPINYYTSSSLSQSPPSMQNINNMNFNYGQQSSSCYNMDSTPYQSSDNHHLMSVSSNSFNNAATCYSPPFVNNCTSNDQLIGNNNHHLMRQCAMMENASRYVQSHNFAQFNFNTNANDTQTAAATHHHQ